MGLPSDTVPFFFFLPVPEGTNYRNVLDKAVQADQVVRERYNGHCEMIALLCKPEPELSAAIPSANPAMTLQGSEVSAVTWSRPGAPAPWLAFEPRHTADRPASNGKIAKFLN